MTEISIVISYSDTMQRVYAESGYTAKARNGIGLSPELSDSMSASEDDSMILERSFISGAKDAAALITRYMAPCYMDIIRNDDTDIIEEILLNFNAPRNFHPGVMTTLEKSVEDFIAGHIMQKWMMIMKPDEADIAALKLQNESIRIREMLATRKKPE